MSLGLPQPLRGPPTSLLSPFCPSHSGSYLFALQFSFLKRSFPEASFICHVGKALLNTAPIPTPTYLCNMS